jgi:peptidoglycan/xylan/chitin deacetylase (PgdA/CDA1 family)
MGFKHTLFTAAFAAVSGVGADRWLRVLAQGSGVILMFHRVRPHHSRQFAPNRSLEITPAFLDVALTELEREGFELIAIDAVADRLRLSVGVRPFAVLTFDDGYRDNIEYALPVLRRHNAPWTLFVTTDFLDGRGRLWWLELEESITRLNNVALQLNGELVNLSSRTPAEKQIAFDVLYKKLRSGPADRLQPTIAALTAEAGIDTRRLVSNFCLGWEEVQTLAREADVSIGAHSVSHPILAKCDLVTAKQEITESKALLEQRLGKPVGHLAYPFGDSSAVSARELCLAQQAGYVTAVTSRPGHVFNDHANHLHALPRISVNGLFQNVTALRSLLSGIPFWL